MSSSQQPLLIEHAKTGNANELSRLISQHKHSPETIDLAYRSLLANFRSIPSHNFYSSFRTLNQHVNVNFQNKSFNNSTILMECVRLGLNAQCEKIIHYFKCINDSTNRINLDVYDDYGESILYKIISSTKFASEDERLNLFNELISNEQFDVNHVNSDGFDLLSFALGRGRYFIAAKLISSNGARLDFMLNSNGESLLHCAVRGGNVLNVLLMLQHLDKDYHLSIKNLEGKTPENLAKQLKQSKVVSLLQAYSLSNSDDRKVSQKELLKLFTNNAYEKIMNQLTINANSCSNGAMDIFPYQFNKLLCEYKIDCERNDKTESEINSITATVLNNIYHFFKSKERAISHQHPLAFFNYLVMMYKLGKYSFIEQSIVNYKNANIKDIMHDEKQLFLYWILFVNAYMMICVNYINEKNVTSAQNALNVVDSYIQLNQPNVNVDYNEITKEIFDYLKTTNTVNQLSNADSVLQMIRLYMSIELNEHEKAKSIIMSCKDRYVNNSNGSSGLEHNLTNMFRYLTIKFLYQVKDALQFEGELNQVLMLANDDNNADQYVHNVFYYNTLGISHLRKRDYTFAEYCFKHCEQLIKHARQNEHTLYFVTNFLPHVRYNLSLAYFQSKQYVRCQNILTQCKSYKQLSLNPYVTYRLGVCSLELALLKLKEEEEQTCGISDIIDHLNVFDTSYQAIHLHKYKSELNVQAVELLSQAVKHFQECLLIINAMKSTAPSAYLIPVFNNCAISLLYCFNILKQPNYVLFFSEQFVRNVLYDKRISNVYVVDYRIEAYLHLNEPLNAIALIESEMQNESESSATTITTKEYGDIDYKMCLHLKLVKAKIMSGNLDGVDALFKTIIQLYTSPHNAIDELPQYITSVMLHYLLLLRKHSATHSADGR